MTSRVTGLLYPVVDSTMILIMKLMYMYVLNTQFYYESYSF